MSRRCVSAGSRIGTNVVGGSFSRNGSQLTVALAPISLEASLARMHAMRTMLNAT